jgi:hypothetical protein
MASSKKFFGYGKKALNHQISALPHPGIKAIIGESMGGSKEGFREEGGSSQGKVLGNF